MSEVDERFMTRCLELAEQAAAVSEVPIGAVVVHEGEIVGEGRNTREGDRDPLGHAEILAIRAAAAHLDRWRLSGTTLYVTLEPCFMCAGAIVNARIDRVVYGAVDPKAGAVTSLATVLADARLNHQPEVLGGVMGEVCSAHLKSFFAALRNKR